MITINHRNAMTTPRGIRNCNPLNIRKTTGRPWLGQVRPGEDPEFCQFTDMAHGYRAAMRLLQNYGKLYGLRTVRQLISRWAPPQENDTRGYVNTVCYLTKWDPERTVALDKKADMVALVSAMSQMENGRKADPQEVEAGWRLLRNGSE